MWIYYLLISHSMSTQQGKSVKKSRPNYITSIVSVALVLFIVGFLMVFYLQSSYLVNSLKENVQLQLELKDNINEADIFQYRKLLESAPYVKGVEYISKDEAAKRMQKELGENFIELLGFNPLFASLNVNLKAAYSNTDSIQWIKEDILKSNHVKDIIYDLTLVEAIDNNAKKFAVIIAGVSLIFFLIAMFLIDSTIKLAMYSNRFLIRSMKLVGATHWFIIKPFILRGIFNGFISGTLASLALIWLLIYAENKLYISSVFENWTDLAIVVASILTMGILISWISTHRAVLKYLNSKLENLY
jgi:cell division transport system permease protein